MPHLPCLVIIGEIAEQHVEIFDDQQNLLTLAVGKIKKLPEWTISQPLIVKFGSHFIVSAYPFFIAGLVRQMRQSLKPEVSGRRGSVAFFGKDQGVPVFTQLSAFFNFRSDAKGKSRLSAAARTYDEYVLVGICRILADYPDNQFQVGMADHKVVDKVILGKKRRVKFHETCCHDYIPLSRTGT